LQKEPVEIQQLVIHWPNGCVSQANGDWDWLTAARQAGFPIPTGCLGGSCGACEIQVNGEVLRACISNLGSSPAAKPSDKASDKASAKTSDKAPAQSSSALDLSLSCEISEDMPRHLWVELASDPYW
jgi:ferredoxin